MRILFLLICSIISFRLYASDHFKDSIAIAESAIKAQSERLKIVSQNLANEYSTSIEPGGNPYRRKTIAFKNKYDRNAGLEKVKIIRYGQDKSPYRMVYDPSHPAADKLGYVLYPNVDKNIEMRDAMEAERSIEANISAIETSKRLIAVTLDILR